MDLPTYTNIWRIEKRLYKLYDLRLPMPLPIVWIGVFLGVLAVWTLLLRLLRVPFETPWHVLYLVPPGVVTWLSTRPVIENKRLTELLQSQLRYLGEPRTWCRMAPATEPDEIRFEARVWRLPPEAAAALAEKRAKRRAKAAETTTRPRDRRAAAPAAAPAFGATARAARAASARVAPPLEIGTGATASPAARSGRDERARAGAAAGPAVRPAEPTPVAAAPARPGGDDADRRVVGEINPAVAAAAAAVTGARTDAAPADGNATTGRRGRARAVADVASGPDAADHGAAARPDDTGGRADERAADAGTGDGADAGGTAERPLKWGDVTTTPWRRTAAGTTGPAESDDGSVPPGGGVVRLLPVMGAEPRPRTGGRQAAASPADAGDRPATPAGLGAEALRRLRRLATSAERTAEPPADGPAATPGDASARPPSGAPARAADGTAGERVTADGTAADPAAVRDAALPDATPDDTADAGTAETTAAAGTRPTAADPAGTGTVADTTDTGAANAAGSAPAAERAEGGAAAHAATTAAAEAPGTEADDDLAEARRRHRKGRPPRRTRPPQRRGTVPPVTIRAVPAPDPAEATNPAAPAVPDPAVRRFPEPKVRRVEAVVGRDTSGGWRRLAQVVVGMGTGRTDGSEIDEARARSAISTSKRIVVLGCTGGAGQTTTALMLGHTLATYREDRVLAVDANTGPRTLSHMIAAESPETLTSLLEGLDEVSGYLSMRAYTTRCASGLEVIAADTDERATQRLADRSVLSDQRLAEAIRMLDRHYKLILIDPAAAVAARVLPYADQLILVAPASADAPDAIAMTYDWLDGHGCTHLRRRAVLVVNGVSRRSLADVEQAESVASGRCRAIVRVPWDEELAPGGTEPLELGHLRTATRRAYVALAGVVASGLGAERPRDRAARAANEDR